MTSSSMRQRRIRDVNDCRLSVPEVQRFSSPIQRLTWLSRVVPTPSIRGIDIEGIGALNLATELRLKSDEGKQQRPILLDFEGQFCLASSSGP